MAHIVVVEDNPTLLENITFELEMVGYQVTTATDGHNAIDTLKQMQQRPDLIVSDIAMPNMDGYEFLEAVRQNTQWNAIPFIFLTAFDTSNAIRLGKQMGVDDYLVKPFEPEDLVLAIENKLKRHREINSQAERNLDEKRRELINMIAHELRTPMTSMYGGIEMLEYSLKEVSDNTTSQMLELVQAGTKRLYGLINRVVMMVQLESGQLRRSLETSSNAVDLNDLTMQTLKEFDLPARNVSVKLKFADDKLHVKGVRDYLKQAVYELLDNAIKFSPPEGVVHVETTCKDNHAHIMISDEGIGIPKEDINRIWEHLTQVDRKVYEQQGVGLGLTIVRDIITTHRGKCEIVSADKTGTKVLVTLPIADKR